jgi:malonyl-CoA decarboxylase
MSLIASRGSEPSVELQRTVPDRGDETQPSLLRRLLRIVADRWHAYVNSRHATRTLPDATRDVDADLATLGEVLLSRRGEASGVAIAERLLNAYAEANEDRRIHFLRSLADRFGPDVEQVTLAAHAFLSTGTPTAAQALHVAAEPRRQELFRRLNLAPGGTAALIQMREELLKHMSGSNELKAVDADMLHLLTAWFNRGFLVVRPIDWRTPAHILAKIIRYEAVHEIKDWEDLRRRIEPPDRRCFAFFHPVLVDEPLIFVEVALTCGIPHAIEPLLTAKREVVPTSQATTAVFYSISNCQVGLRGISFGNFLIKQVAHELQKALPSISTFVTLSPVPGFSRWLDKERRAAESTALSPADRQTLEVLDTPDWFRNTEHTETLRAPLLKAATHYFLRAKAPNGRPLDPVARFHLGNGARLHCLNPFGDISLKGIEQSKGLMVNYLYDLTEVERNHELFANAGDIVASASIHRLLGQEPG